MRLGKRAAAVGVVPALLGTAAVGAALMIQYGAALQSMRLSLSEVILLVALVSFCWLLGVKHMSRTALAEGRKFETLLDAAPEAIIGVSDDGAIRFANSRVSELFGYTAVELAGAPVELLIPERFHAGHVSSRLRYVESPRVRPMGSRVTLVARRKDGSELPVEISLGRIETREGHLALCVVRDVTEQASTRQALLDANRELKASVAEIGRRAEELRQLTSLGELLQCCADEQEVHAVVSHSIAELFPDTTGGLYLLHSSRNLVELETVWKIEPDRLKRTFLPQECWALRRGHLHTSRIGADSARCRHDADGDGDGCDSLCIPMVAQGDTVGVLHTRYSGANEARGRARTQVLHAIAEQAALATANLRLRDALRTQSIRDPLTGLYNRRFLDEWLDREIGRSRSVEGSLTLLLLDLDHFKRFNDSFGHQSGDLALREVCGLLQRTVRASDVVCRFGGEEIAVLLPDTPASEGMLVGEKLRSEVEHLVIQRNGQPLGALTTSIGLASFPEHGRAAEDLLSAADAALYAAKDTGRNCIVLASC